MPQTCTICRHAQRDEIETETTNGTPLRHIAKRFGVGMSSVRRHRVACIGKKSVWRCPGCYGRLRQDATYLFTCAACGCHWDTSRWRK